MKPFRAFAIAVFVSLFTACGEDSPTEYEYPLPYPGTYACTLHDTSGQAHTLALIYNTRLDRRFEMRTLPQGEVSGAHITGDYDPPAQSGTLTTFGETRYSVLYEYSFDGEALAGHMTLIRTAEPGVFDIDAFVVMVRE